MAYTIREVSQLTGIPASTLRYYETESILPPIQRSKSGQRVYTDDDLECIGVISCLKATDMPMSDVKRFIQLCQSGDETLEERRKIVVNHKRKMDERLVQFMKNMKHIDYKIAYYNAACKAGTERELKKQPYQEALENPSKQNASS
jgi:DNA-binding transcriptional MerR regulator